MMVSATGNVGSVALACHAALHDAILYQSTGFELQMRSEGFLILQNLRSSLILSEAYPKSISWETEEGYSVSSAS